MTDISAIRAISRSVLGVTLLMGCIWVYILQGNGKSTASAVLRASRTIVMFRFLTGTFFLGMFFVILVVMGRGRPSDGLVDDQTRTLP